VRRSSAGNQARLDDVGAVEGKGQIMQPKPVLNTPIRVGINAPARVGIIGTYIPRRCGIATFSADLLGAMKEEAPETEFWSIAMNDVAEGYDYPPEVQFEIGQKVVADYRNAVDFLNMNEFLS
jgi:hypothetical protein